MLIGGSWLNLKSHQQGIHNDQGTNYNHLASKETRKWDTFSRNKANNGDHFDRTQMSKLADKDFHEVMKTLFYE